MEIDKTKQTNTGVVVVLIAVVVAVALYYIVSAPTPVAEREVPATTTPTGTTDQTEAPAQEGDFETYTTSGQYYEISALVPVEGGEFPGAAAVRSEIMNSIETFIDEANADGPETASARGTVIPYEYDVNLTYYAGGADGYSSYYQENYRYSGGANGNVDVATYNFSANGRQISQQDLIAPELQVTFLNDVKAQLQEREFAADEIFRQAIDELTFADLNLYFNDSNQIVAVFSEYTVAPGSYGPVNVELSADQY